MTPAEQARKDVEGWWGTTTAPPIGGFDSLIARLTPVYERAQEFDAAWATFPAERDALRERAERATADRYRLVEEYKAETLLRCDETRRANTAEADVARLREEAREFAETVLYRGTPCTSDYEDACAWLVRHGFLKPCPPGGCEHYGACQVEALAATERKG